MSDNWRDNFQTFSCDSDWLYQPITLAWVVSVLAKWVAGFVITAPFVAAVYLFIIGVACIGGM